MGFNNITLLEFVFGMLIPAVIIAYFLLSKNRREIAFDSIVYGFVSFLGSGVAVFIVFMIINALFLSSIGFNDDTSGLKLAGTIFSAMAVVLFGFCETFKIMTIQNFQKRETGFRMPGVGFSAGVIIAQNLVVFIGLNMLNDYDMDASYALYSGGIVCFTGIMYVVLSIASQSILKSDTNSAPAYAISSVYYLFWIAAIVCSGSTALLYTVGALFFVLTFVLGGVFIFKKSKRKSIEGENFDS